MWSLQGEIWLMRFHEEGEERTDSPGTPQPLCSPTTLPGGSPPFCPIDRLQAVLYPSCILRIAWR